MRFLVLGPLEVTEDSGDRVLIPGTKERTILACLIARVGRVASVDDLIDELWGEDPPRTAEKTLGSYVSRLRRSLSMDRSLASSSDVVVSRGLGYSLETAGHEIDAVRFETLAHDGHELLDAGQPIEARPVLQEALDLWRGTAYQGYRYTGFGATEGERLDELRRTAAEELIDSRLGAGEAGQLIPELEAMVREEPLREQRWRQLMLALYRAGRQGEALRAFTRAREVLVDELGIEPGRELQRLQSAILAQDPELDRARRAQEEPVRATDVCPYKGLARFETDDAEFFFGREEVIAEAVGHLVSGRFLALVGASGSGKSSLLRAGLLHALGSGAIPGSARWAYRVMRPGEHPLDVWTHAMTEWNDGGRLLVALDQFEEVFTACADESERGAFLDAITEAATAPEGPISVVLAMRADFYGRCGEHRTLASLMSSEQILVGPLDGEELRRAIDLPAQHAGLTVEKKLSEALVSDTIGQPGGLPLLSTALLELWTHRHDRTLSLDDYLRFGGIEGAVARLAEDAFRRLDVDEQAAAKRILLRLAASDEEAHAVRRRASLSEFDLDQDADASRALAVLTDARLVTVAEGTAEVAHEALLREWPRLCTWLAEDAEGRVLHRNLTRSSQTWDEGGQDPADLYRGARLTVALEWAAPHAADLNELEGAFLEASRTASEGEAARARRTNRRLRGLLAGMALLLAMSLLIGSLALSQRDQARNAFSVADAGRLASGSRLEADPVVALIMAREAVDIDDSVQTRSALFAALERSPAITNRIHAAGGPSPAGAETQWIAISPDGKTLAIGGTGPMVQFFDAGRYAYVGGFTAGSGTERATFSPDGKTLVVATSNGELESVDVATRTRHGRASVGGSVDAIGFNPDGTRLVTAENSDGREFLVSRDPVTLQSRGPKRATPWDQDHAGQLQIAPLFSMAFTPDGRSLLTTSDTGPTVLWHAAHLTRVRLFKIAGAGVAVSPNGAVAAIIVNSHHEGNVSFLNLQTDGVQPGSGGHHGPFTTAFEATGIAFTPDGRSIITVGNDSRLLVWDVATASVREELASASGLPLRGPAISHDGATAFTTDASGDVAVWDLSGNRRLGRTFTAGSGHIEWPFFAVSPDGRTMAVISAPTPSVQCCGTGPYGREGGTIELIDTSTLRAVQRIRYARTIPVGLAFGPDSRTLAVGSWIQPVDQTRGQYHVRLWDVVSGKPLTPDLPGIPPGVESWAMAFSPDGSAIAAGGPVWTKTANGEVASGDAVPGRVFLWSVAEPRQLVGTHETPVGKPVWDMTFTPDGSALIAATGFDDGAIFSWDTRTGAMAWHVHTVDRGVSGLDVSNDGRTLVSGSQDGTVHIWDARSGASLGKPLTGLHMVNTVDMSPDGSSVVVTDNTGTVLLWDVTSGTIVGGPFPDLSQEGALAAHFASDGQSVVVISDSGSGWLWDVDPSHWEARACQVAGRSLTLQEWQQLLPGRPYFATCGS